MLIDQPGQHPPSGMTLLLRGIQIAVYGPNRGATRTADFRGGGTAEANA